MVRTAKNEVYSFLNHEIVSGNTSVLDIPSLNFRKLLVTLNKENTKTKVLFTGKDSYYVKELSAIGE